MYIPPPQIFPEGRGSVHKLPGGKVRTDCFLDPKFKTFSRSFSKNNNFFFQTQGCQIVDQQRP